MKKKEARIFFNPVIRFSYNTFNDWFEAGLSLKEIAEYLEDMRIKIKKATGYEWDNEHFEITSIFASAIPLTFSINDKTINFWRIGGTESIGEIAGPLTEEKVKTIGEWLEKAGKNLLMCNVCHKWLKKEEMKSYSFAGVVCLKCFDPEKHKGPDTRGD